MKIVITGSSAGLGKSLYQKFKSNGHDVVGISRSESSTTDLLCDLSRLEEVNFTFNSVSKENDVIDYLFLNAGVLGKINKANEINQSDLIDALQINVLSNKAILDTLINHKVTIKNVIAISSGASNKAYDGWLMYCLSKSALNQLISCYAIENKDIHFLSLAPGIMQTKMQDLIVKYDSNKFSSIEKFKSLYGYNDTPDKIAHKIFMNLERFSSIESGRFFDLRDIRD